ncbi:MAG TPA: recombinase family protein, partial [Candidatus Saccharimonadales bacterium]|nr:recombinase family protein [Candidatus Saccharimonadales bacterium]
QQKRIRKTADKLGVEIVNEWSDIGSSRVTRKHLDEIVEFCKKNKDIRYLLVDSVDRLSRNFSELMMLKVTLDKLGVETVTPNGSLVSDFAYQISAVFAQHDSDIRRERVRRGMQSRVQNGYSVSQPVFGYKTGPDSGLHIPDKKNFKKLEKAMRKFKDGRSLRDTLKWLNSKIKSNKPMPISKFRAILASPYYAGFNRFSGELYLGKHLPMVSFEEHTAIQKRLEEDEE